MTGMLDVNELVEMVMLDIVEIEDTGESTVELRIDGEVIGEQAARGHYGWFYIPGSE